MYRALRVLRVAENRFRCGVRFSGGSTAVPPQTNLWEFYLKRKAEIEGFDLPVDVSKHAVFANNETRLDQIDVYGFDYDYTLASYKPELHYLLYNLGRDLLVKKYKYPDDIIEEYDPKFAVRGIHFDIRKGLLMKIDAFHHIQLGTVYRGLRSVSDDDVKAMYEGTHVSLDNMSSFYGKGSMYQLMDMFALSEITLLANVIEYFIERNIPFDPEYVYLDVSTAVRDIHATVLHQTITSNLDKYLEKRPEVNHLLVRLVKAKKKLFLITNSSFHFVDAGMKYLVGPKWQGLFDVVITNARKPKFFHETTRPFRIHDVATGTPAWDRVQFLQKGTVYQQGNFSILRQITGWYGSSVLYFGDHVYSDLADAAVRHGWRTGAIIPELELEIEKINSTEYKCAVRWAIVLQQLVERMQVDLLKNINIKPDSLAISRENFANVHVWTPEYKSVTANLPLITIERHEKEDGASAENKIILLEWLRERDRLRDFTKALFNPYFGSVFRTHHNSSYFSRRLSRFADIYTSSLTNLLNYSTDHTFYPRRAALPHEPQPYSNILFDIQGGQGWMS